MHPRAAYYPPLQPLPPPPPSPPTENPTLKRNYLSLLPPDQIIAICLLLDPHVPVHIRRTVWPPDLNAAILALENTTTTTPTPAPAPAPHSTHAPAAHVTPPPVLDAHHDDPPMSSLRISPPAPDPAASAPSTAHPTRPPTPTGGRAQNAPQEAPPAQPPHPAPQYAQPAPHAASPPPPVPYPYAPYGYALPGQPPHAAYPHTPYYAAAYPAPYPGYAPYPAPPAYPPHPHPHMYPPRPPPQPAHEPVHAEDLPSYEDMIAEALLDAGDPEGLVPKDLFSWMASRWPLQTNFRPSASQALQKAYKRGRLEKRPNGRYRLNPSWEGGATSKRTTRRPQTLAQTTFAQRTASQPPSSPFTHAPLPPPSPPPHPYPYPYYAGYPSYPPYPPAHMPAPPAVHRDRDRDKDRDRGGSGSGNGNDGDGENGAERLEDGAGDSDAWEAAQHILKAINFGAAAPVPPVVAAADVDFVVARAAPRAILSDAERATLQAQLALLAAQLAEIAEEEEREAPMVAMDIDLFASGGGQKDAGTAVNADGDGEDGEEEESDDGDMERVDLEYSPTRTAWT